LVAHNAQEYSMKLAILVLSLIAGAVPPTHAAPPRSEPIVPVPNDQRFDDHKVALGRLLFHDARLSKGGAVSCASCHNLRLGGADGRITSLGLDGRSAARNAPSIFNAVLNFRQGWEGRQESLERQTEFVMHDPNVMGSSWLQVTAALRKDAAMEARFRDTYPDGLQPHTLADALNYYQRSLLTPNSRFDRWLRGDQTALRPDEVRGYMLFKTNGCVACHQGVNIGGNMFQVFGVMGDKGAYFRARGNVTKADLGRYNLTGNEADRYVFKVPSLRNVALTAPYFHDGSAATLEEAVQVMFKHQLGRSPNPSDVDLIVKFLRTLSGDLDGQPLAGRTD
jgi:cytochrome c peroxidase